MSGAIWPDVQHHVIIWSWLFKYLMSIQPTVSLIEMLKIFLSENRQYPWDATLLHDYVTACMTPVLYQQPLPLEQLMFLFDFFQIVISEHMRMMLERRFNCVIRVNNAGYYHDFEILEDDQGTSTSNTGRSTTTHHRNFSKAEDHQMLSYLHEMLMACDGSPIKFANLPFWDEGNRKMKLDRQTNSIYSRFQKLKHDPKLIMKSGLDGGKLLFLMKNMPVSLKLSSMERILEEIGRKYNYFITADTSGQVLEWKQMDGSLQVKMFEIVEAKNEQNVKRRRQRRARTSAIGLSPDDQ